MSVIVRPVIVLGAPRSGTTILRNCLALHPDLWHLAGESHEILEGPFDPAPAYVSNRVEAADVDDALAATLRLAFADRAINLTAGGAGDDTVRPSASLVGRVVDKVRTRVSGKASMRHRPGEIRFLEKTPKNMLRVPMLERVLPRRVVRAPHARRAEQHRLTDRGMARRRPDRPGDPAAVRPIRLPDRTAARAPRLRRQVVEVRARSGMARTAREVPGRRRRLAVLPVQPHRARRSRCDRPGARAEVAARGVRQGSGRRDPRPVRVGGAGTVSRGGALRRCVAASQHHRRPGTAPDALRNADGVRTAIASTPGLDTLRAELGYV